jgi:signal transduction histidine kinase
MLRPSESERSPRLVLRFAFLTGIALLLAAAGVMWFVRDQAIERAERMIEYHTRFVADTILRHELRQSDFERPPPAARQAELDRLFREQVLVEGTLRVKLWAPNGTITYSNDHALVARVADGSEPDALARAIGGDSLRNVARLNGDGGSGQDVKVVEAYVPVRLAAGRTPAGVFQLYEDYAPVEADIRSAVTPVGIVLALALIGLWVSLFPILRRVTAALESRNRRLAEQATTLECTLAERTAAEEARRRSEEQLRQSQKMEAVGRLAGGIAHDFNNLLLVINGYSELALARLEDAAAELREPIDEVRAAGERAAALTRQLLAFSRKQVIQPTELDLNAVVAETSKMLGRILGEHLELILDLAPLLDPVRADRGQLEQILMNLTVNARDAMPDGGLLRIATETVALPEGRRVALTVSDTGVGMDAETQRSIFEPFFTTKAAGEGTGLGLSTVYGIVEQSHGRLVVESEIGRGTTFTIYLPAATGTAERAYEEQDETPVPAAARGTERILVVEDNAPVRNLVAEALAMEGYDVTAAEDAHEALAIAERNEKLDLLLTDIVMPEMNGRELARRIGERRPGLRVLYTSGYAGEHREDIDDGHPVIEKPYPLPSLAAKVREILDAAPHAA